MFCILRFIIFPKAFYLKANPIHRLMPLPRRCLLTFAILAVGCGMVTFLVWVTTGIYGNVVASVNWVKDTKEYECYVVSAEPTTCLERSTITKYGHTVTVEVNGSRCGILIRKICPNDKNVTINTTIPCYIDDGCNFDINEPSIDSVAIVGAVFLTGFSCIFLVAVLYIIIGLVSKKKEERQNGGSIYVSSGDLSNPLTT
eukprot:TRINITY_DN1543_c0_g1_i2.p1 TRINITY_DN1543_c0_g1~~TRINITY_DN1543_c0_g1_i2.p1  ORF type:complete len:200 (+),score=14.81 TRINITY_DN1543_c0_g1_i2:886-1485(+)